MAGLTEELALMILRGVANKLLTPEEGQEYLKRLGVKNV